MKASPVDPQSPGEPFRPPLTETRPVSFLAAAKSPTIKDRWSRLDRWGRADPLAALGRREYPQTLGAGPGPVVSCHHLILRKRPLLEQPANVATADVHLSQSLELNDGKLAHDRFGSRSRDSEFSRQVLCVEELGEGFSQRLPHAHHIERYWSSVGIRLTHSPKSSS